MFLKLLKAKIHGARVTQADLNYVGSITIDEDLMETAGIVANEHVLVADVDNANRLETYVLPGKRGSREICLNGAAARLVHVGDTILIIVFAYFTPEEAQNHKATIVVMNQDNTIKETLLK